MHAPNMNRRERSMRDDSYPRSRRTPSFSSTLLDAIYRSTDESKSNLDEDPQLGLYKQKHKSKQSNLSHNHGVSGERKDGKERNVNLLRRAVMVEDWMEKRSSQSSHSSSECSSGGFFSSSETETSFKLRSKFKSERTQKKKKNSEKKKQQNVKQPISPGSRIASFLSSIFNSGNVKKAKMCYVGAVEDVSFEQKSQSPCLSSSANSSISRRSCMSKTNKSSNNGVKRSVRFYPISVILGEDSQHKCIYENDPNLMALPGGFGKITRSSSMKELKKKIEEEAAAARGFRKCYQNPLKGQFDFRDLYKNNDNGEDEEDEDDDALSYSSSDLFELDHLVGDWRYQQELPVYETTDLETNKAIANGLRL